VATSSGQDLSFDGGGFMRNKSSNLFSVSVSVSCIVSVCPLSACADVLRRTAFTHDLVLVVQVYARTPFLAARLA